jgi:hypothetical protein
MQRFDQPVGMILPLGTPKQESSILAAKYISEWCAAIAELIATIERWLSPLQESGKLHLLRSNKLVKDLVSQQSYHIDHLEILVNGSKRLSLVPVSASRSDHPGRVHIEGLKQETVLLRKMHPLSPPSWLLVFDESSPKSRAETQLSHGVLFTLLARMINSLY